MPLLRPQVVSWQLATILLVAAGSRVAQVLQFAQVPVLLTALVPAELPVKPFSLQVRTVSAGEV
jgi:hypothetical protein